MSVSDILNQPTVIYIGILPLYVNHCVYHIYTVHPYCKPYKTYGFNYLRYRIYNCIRVH